jgi:hypothetical protein
LRVCNDACFSTYGFSAASNLKKRIMVLYIRTEDKNKIQAESETILEHVIEVV